MKTSTPKLLIEERPLQVEQRKFLGLFSSLINLVTLFIALIIVYIMLFPLDRVNKNNLDNYALHQAPSVEQPASIETAPSIELNKNLSDIKNYLIDLKKVISEDADNTQKMSKSFHIKLLVSSIKTKITSGSDFKMELEELRKFTYMQKDMNFQILHEYLSRPPTQVNMLISSLYDEAANHNKNNDGAGFIESAKHFFTNLFTVKKVEDHKIHATTNEITSIIVQLLLDGRIEAAYTVSNKFRGAHASIAKIADTLKPINDALNAASKVEIYG